MSQEKDTAVWALRAIQSGDVDPYLRAIFEAVRNRREVLGKDLPKQDTITPDDVNINLEPALPVGVTQAVQTVQSHKAHPKFRKDQRPDPKIPTFTGRVAPTTTPNVPVTLMGNTYDKHDLVGKCIGVDLANAQRRVQIVGVGDKTVKVLLVDEPERGTYHGKKELHSIWDANMPLFLAHSILTPYLLSK